MTDRDLYAVLGVERDASPDEIKAAWRALAREVHPDRAPDDPRAEARFQEAAEAWEILSDPTKRMVYDAFGKGALQKGWTEELAEALRAQQAQEARAQRAAHGARQAREARQAQEARRADEARQARTHAARTPPKPRPPPRAQPSSADGAGRGIEPERVVGAVPRTRSHDARAQVVLSLAEAARGGSHTIPLQEPGPCASCDGTGKRPSGRFCTKCQGKGLGTSQRPVTVALPISPETGTTVRFPRLGAMGPHGRRGDLFVTITVRPDPRFVREGLNLEVTVPVSAALAARGGRIAVPTLDGEASVELPAGVAPGKRIRIPGAGLPGPDGRPPGDLYAVITVH